jgi:rubrerythrin
MDFSNPFGTLVPRKMNAAELARAIMQDIAAELDAVAVYQAHIDATDDERAKKVLAHVRDDEKEHVGEFLALLEILDPRQAEYIKKGKVELAELLEGK